jgi:hypothetical protein
MSVESLGSPQNERPIHTSVGFLCFAALDFLTEHVWAPGPVGLKHVLIVRYRVYFKKNLFAAQLRES